MLIVHMLRGAHVGITAMPHYSGVITGTCGYITPPPGSVRLASSGSLRPGPRLASDNVVAPLAARSHSVIRFDRHRADRAQMPDTEWSADASHPTAPRVPYVGRVVRMNACRKRS